MNQIKPFDFCVLGSICSDLVLEVDSLPNAGIMIPGKIKFKGFGGKGANPAVLISRAGHTISYIGQVGKDFIGDDVLKFLEENGVNIEGVVKVDCATGQGFIFLQGRGENTIAASPGANMFYKTVDELPSMYKVSIEKSKILLLSRSVPNNINVLAAKLAKQNNMVVGLDYGYRDDAFSEELLQNVDFVNPNEVEMIKLLTSSSMMNADSFKSSSEILEKSLALIDRFPQLRVLLKLGEHGCHFITKKINIKIPTVNQINPLIKNNYKVIDTTGAGDCFIGSFFVKYIEIIFIEGARQSLIEETSEKIYKCMLFASISSFLCVCKLGSMNSMPFRKEIDEFYATYFPNDV